MKKVLYIAFNYNHDTGIASKRLRGVAKYLPSFGWPPVAIVPRTSNETVEECKKAIYDYYIKYNNDELNYCGNRFAEEYSLKNTAKRFAQLLEEVQ